MEKKSSITKQQHIFTCDIPQLPLVIPKCLYFRLTPIDTDVVKNKLIFHYVYIVNPIFLSYHDKVIK